MHRRSMRPIGVTEAVIGLSETLLKFLNPQFDFRSTSCVVCGLPLGIFHRAGGGGNSHISLVPRHNFDNST